MQGLVVVIANERSLAWSAAQHFRNAGAELAVTYLNDKAKPFVEPLAHAVSAPILMPCDVAVDGQLEAVVEMIGGEWGRLDFLLHSIAWIADGRLERRLYGELTANPPVARPGRGNFNRSNRMDGHDHSTGTSASSSRFWRTRAGMTLIGFLTIAGLLLAFEHRAHLFTGFGPLVLVLLLCVGMHVFMHGGHGHGGGGHGDDAGDGQ